MSTVGYIYILTNPSFREYVKIGYANNVERRLKELNRSECVPFAFRIYATYEVSSRLSDKKIHAIIDKLNPNLRAIETYEGKERKREFYAMTPKDAYDLLEAIAEIHGCKEKLVLYKKTKEEEEQEEEADEIIEQHRERGPFRFSYCGIQPGEEIEFWSNKSTPTGVICKVLNDKQIQYNGETYSLSGLATKILEYKWTVQGPKYFKYHDEWLDDIRKRKEVEDSE